MNAIVILSGIALLLVLVFIVRLRRLKDRRAADRRWREDSDMRGRGA